MKVLAIIPARHGSLGIPGKNFKELLPDVTPVSLAIACARGAGIPWVLTTDAPVHGPNIIHRPPALATDTTSMLAVVEHVLSVVPGPPDELILLLQPTSPLRQVKHLRAAIKLLRGVDSVVSVRPTAHPGSVCTITRGRLVPWCGTWASMPTRRQQLAPVYQRDGTVYVFWRRTVTEQGSLYGRRCRPLVLPASESLTLDTPEDWDEAKWRMRAGRP